MIEVRTILSLCFVLTALACAYGVVEVNADQLICVRDSTGANVCVKNIPQRVVSLAPSLSELMFDLNAGSRLAGRTTRCNFPEEAKRVTDVGPYMAPDFEKLLKVKPDLVLATRNGMRSELIQRIKGLGIPVYVDDSSNIDEIELLITKVGSLLGQDEKAKELNSGIEQRRKNLRKMLAGLDRPSVIFVVGINPLIVASSSSFLNSLISEAGGANVVNDLKIQFPKFSMEEVIRLDPDVIFMLDKECHGVECLDYWKNYGFLKAIKSSRVYEVDSDLVSRPGARIIDALEALTGHLHPVAAIPVSSPGVHARSKVH